MYSQIHNANTTATASPTYQLREAARAWAASLHASHQSKRSRSCRGVVLRQIRHVASSESRSFLLTGELLVVLELCVILTPLDELLQPHRTAGPLRARLPGDVSSPVSR